MKSHITKADYTRYLECPLYAWLWKNKPELRQNIQNSRISDQGYEVEVIARDLFDKGIEISGDIETAHQQTLHLMKGGKITLYQATFITDQFISKVDILIKDETGNWHLYEVKSSTQKKKEHIDDIAFQTTVIQDSGIRLSTINLVHVNNQYIYDDKVGIEPEKFLAIQDITDEVLDYLPDVKPHLDIAYKQLTNPTQPSVPALKKNFKYPLPEKLSDYYWQGVSEYSIYDIANIRVKTLIKLTDQNMHQIVDIPEGFFPSKKMNDQVELTKEKSQMIDTEAINGLLGQLEYPLYFLDYETINPAIPLFNQTKPYEQIPFQYSLHVLESKDADCVHMDFLHSEKSNPIPSLLKSLREAIGSKGTVIVWNQSFEKGRNIFMGEFCPEYKDFLDSVNECIFDLMIIFQKYYLDYRFKGSASIKNVLPVLVPDLRYSDLAIQHGGMAIDGILDLVQDDSSFDRQTLISDLKAYCEQDTLAMVRIYKSLLALMINRQPSNNAH